MTGKGKYGGLKPYLFPRRSMGTRWKLSIWIPGQAGNEEGRETGMNAMDTCLRRYDIRKNDSEILKLGTGFRRYDWVLVQRKRSNFVKLILELL